MTKRKRTFPFAKHIRELIRRGAFRHNISAYDVAELLCTTIPEYPDEITSTLLLSVSNACNYLARQGELLREKVGHTYVYSAPPPQHESGTVSVPSPTLVIERLLQALAEAEPVLRACQRMLNEMEGMK